MHRSSDRVPDRSRLEPVIASGCVQPDGMGLQGGAGRRGLREMPKLPKIQKRCAFNGLAGIGRPAGNWLKMPKFESGATAVHASTAKPRGKCTPLVQAAH